MGRRTRTSRFEPPGTLMGSRSSAPTWRAFARMPLVQSDVSEGRRARQVASGNSAPRLAVKPCPTRRAGCSCITQRRRQFRLPCQAAGRACTHPERGWPSQGPQWLSACAPTRGAPSHYSNQTSWDGGRTTAGKQPVYAMEPGRQITVSPDDIPVPKGPAAFNAAAQLLPAPISSAAETRPSANQP